MVRHAASTIAPLAALLVLGTVAGCHKRHVDPLAECRALLDLPKRNPVADADEATGHGDVRVLMLGGYSVTVPGVDYYPVSGSSKDVGKIGRFSAGRPYIGGRLLRGTGDTETGACRALGPATRRYVFAYNQRIVTYLPVPRP